MTFTVARGACLIFLLVLLENIYAEGFKGRSFRDLKLEQKLKILNKPYVKSFKIGDNDFDTFDCVDIYQQPAFSHPLLKGHKIEMRPSYIPRIDGDKSVEKGKGVDFRNLTQTCPAGTVPIRRTRKEDLVMDQILMKSLDESAPLKDHFSAVTTNDPSVPYYGAYAKISIHSPTVADSRIQYSGAIIRIECTKGDEINTIDAGWTVGVDGPMFNDSQPRLAVAWGKSRGKHMIHGCFNTHCPGFVVVHGNIAPGFPITGLQEAEFLIYKYRVDGNWWLTFKNEPVGYWPKELFTTLQGPGDQVDWAGMVSGPTDKPFPSMGSGHFAEEGLNKAAYFNNLMFLDAEFNLNLHRIVRWNQLSHIVTTPKCYTLQPYGSYGIFYGGPGGNCT